MVGALIASAVVGSRRECSIDISKKNDLRIGYHNSE